MKKELSKQISWKLDENEKIHNKKSYYNSNASYSYQNLKNKGEKIAEFLEKCLDKYGIRCKKCFRNFLKVPKGFWEEASLYNTKIFIL